MVSTSRSRFSSHQCLSFFFHCTSVFARKKKAETIKVKRTARTMIIRSSQFSSSEIPLNSLRSPMLLELSFGVKTRRHIVSSLASGMSEFSFSSLTVRPRPHGCGLSENDNGAKRSCVDFRAFSTAMSPDGRCWRKADVPVVVFYFVVQSDAKSFDLVVDSVSFPPLAIVFGLYSQCSGQRLNSATLRCAVRITSFSVAGVWTQHFSNPHVETPT